MDRLAEKKRKDGCVDGENGKIAGDCFIQPMTPSHQSSNVEQWVTGLKILAAKIGVHQARPRLGPTYAESIKIRLVWVETAGDCYIVSGGIMKQSAGGQTVVESHDPAESAHRVDGVCQGNSGLGSSGMFVYV
eukprot:804591-Pelagomonas_calceolata.AAC.8